jgi:hypothetical protein
MLAFYHAANHLQPLIVIKSLSITSITFFLFVKRKEGGCGKDMGVFFRMIGPLAEAI